MATFTIDLFRLPDYPQVRSLWERTGLLLRPSDALEALLRTVERDPGLFLVARDAAGDVVGTVLGGWDGRRGYLYHLAVAPEWRRRGVATALVDEVERRLRERGAPKVKLQIMRGNEASRAFFAARGYEPEDFCEPWGKELVPGGAPGSESPGGRLSRAAAAG